MRIILLYVVLIMCCISAHGQYSGVKPGDFIVIKGIKAIVYDANEDGSHGAAMAIRCQRGVRNAWCNDKKVLKQMRIVLNSSDGEVNTQALMEWADSNDLLEKFPLFSWCQEMGSDWFIPSREDLEKFAHFWTGDEDAIQEFDWDSDEEQAEVLNDTKLKSIEINEAIMQNGGSPIRNHVYSSSMSEDGRIYVLTYSKPNNKYAVVPMEVQGEIGKMGEARAFIKF